MLQSTSAAETATAFEAATIPDRVIALSIEAAIVSAGASVIATAIDTSIVVGDAVDLLSVYAITDGVFAVLESISMTNIAADAATVLGGHNRHHQQRCHSRTTN